MTATSKAQKRPAIRPVAAVAVASTGPTAREAVVVAVARSRTGRHRGRRTWRAPEDGGEGREVESGKRRAVRGSRRGGRIPGPVKTGGSRRAQTFQTPDAAAARA